MPTHKHITKIIAAGQSGEQEETLTTEFELTVPPVSIANGTTDQLIPLGIDVSQVNSIWIKSTVAMTLETNDGSAPDDTISLVANKPYRWRTGDYASSLLTTDVTPGIYVTNASGAAGTLEIIIGYGDITP